MDYFDVGVVSSETLEASHLVEELTDDSSIMDAFPVLIDGAVNTFTDVDGGYDPDYEHHIVQLVLEKDEIAPYPTAVDSSNYELHLDKFVWTLDVDDVHEYEDSEKYVVTLLVADYESYPHSFIEELIGDSNE